MTFPQPQASQEIIEGQEFFRLYTELQSGGDIYEVDASASAFVIGPQSDLARVRITYFDPSAPNQAQVSSFVVSVDDPFIGRVDAFGTTKYPLGKMPARILVSPEDLYVQGALEATVTSQINTIVIPKIDLLCFLSPPAAVPSKRADFTMEGRITIPDNGVSDAFNTTSIPFYRRKYAAINLNNFSAFGYSYTVQGYNFTTDMSGSSYQLFSKQLKSGVLGSGAQIILEIKASVDGLWDYLAFTLYGSDAVDSAATQACPKFRVTTTDEEV